LDGGLLVVEPTVGFRAHPASAAKLKINASTSGQEFRVGRRLSIILW